MKDPDATYEEVRDRVITRQPEYLAAYRDAHRRPYVPPVPEHADVVVNGKTGQAHTVPEGAMQEPEVKGVKRTRRIWCSVCLRYWSQAEKAAAAHVHATSVPRPAAAKRRPKPRRQYWKSEGLAGQQSLLVSWKR
jgi:hypothetical protein